MAAENKNTKKLNPVVIGALLLVVILAAVFLFQSGILGGGSSCEAIKAKYEKAKEVEHYGDVSKYYSQLMQMGCE